MWLGPVKTLDDVLNGGHKLIAICRHQTCRHRREVDLHLLLGRVSGQEALLPEPGQHFSDLLRCPACRRMGMALWLEPHFERPAPLPEPNYRILDWGRFHPFAHARTLATADNLMVGRGAYAAAALFYRDHRVTFMQGAFLIADSKRDGLPVPETAEDYQRIREAEAGLAGTGAKEN